MAICTSGSGTYRAVAKCLYAGSSLYEYTRVGNTVRIGQISRARCGSNLDRASQAQVQIMST